jgi:protein-S-isoprenylcysteine O-methyltransferase Ste14
MTMNVWTQLRAILLLPGTVTVVIPAIILHFAGMHWLSPPWTIALLATGSILVLLGLTLMATTIGLFITVGKGTLAPWEPTQKLVVRGVYRHVRNPMLTGVFCVLLGEAVFFGSPWLLGWATVFLVVNLIYIPVFEEPGLVSRFGDDYLLYKQNVPRWIPRWIPWEGLSHQDTATQQG